MPLIFFIRGERSSVYIFVRCVSDSTHSSSLYFSLVGPPLFSLSSWKAKPTPSLGPAVLTSIKGFDVPASGLSLLAVKLSAKPSAEHFGLNSENQQICCKSRFEYNFEIVRSWVFISIMFFPFAQNGLRIDNYKPTEKTQMLKNGWI